MLSSGLPAGGPSDYPNFPARDHPPTARMGAGVMSPAARNRAGASATCEKLMGAKLATVGSFKKLRLLKVELLLRFDIASLATLPLADKPLMPQYTMIYSERE